MLSVSCRHHDGFQQECLHFLQSLAAHPSAKRLKRRQLSGDPLLTLFCLFKPKTGRDKCLRVFLWLRVASEKNESEMESLGFRKSFWPHFFFSFCPYLPETCRTQSQRFLGRVRDKWILHRLCQLHFQWWRGKRPLCPLCVT